MKLPRRSMGRPSLGGMLATRQGALILAVLCAAGAAGVLVFALSSYKHNVQIVTPQATVLVATGKIPKGTTGNLAASEKLYRPMPILATQLAAGAISDSSLVTGRVAQADILPGQQLTTADFGAVTGISGLLSPGQRAVSIQTDEVTGDLDVVAPGDHIDIYAVLSTKAVPVVSLLATNVLVLKTPGTPLVGGAAAAPAASSGSSAPSTGGAALVLAVDNSLVPSLGFVAANGKLYVALRPTNATAQTVPAATLESVLAQAATAVSAPNSNTTTTRKHP